MALVRVAILVAFAGCTADGIDASSTATPPDREAFRCNVQPVLEARCAFPACHGSARRPLSIFAPGRLRYQVGWDRPKAPLTEDELAANYRVASGFVSKADGKPLLLAKPLDVDAGGYYHRGKELYKAGDVFLAEDDPGYRILEHWIDGETADPSCTPTTEVGP